MQEMTPAVCSMTNVGIDAQLEDKRDGNKYWVEKMKDGRCWMVQNLALDLTTDGLKASDTNIFNDWNSSSEYPPAATSDDVASGSTIQTAVQSWNFGKWVLATPLLTTDCRNGSAGQTIANCIKVGFVDVSGASFSAGYTATTRSWEGANANSSTLVAVNCTAWSGSGTSKKCTAGTYDAHYLVGNYYSWNAATAGSGGALVGEQASESICPKGWKLPTSGTDSESEWYSLAVSYGVGSKITGTVDGITYDIVGSPIRLVRSGNIVPGSQYVGAAGSTGIYWSSESSSNSTNAANFSFDTLVRPGNGSPRRNGFSVRCVAE